MSKLITWSKTCFCLKSWLFNHNDISVIFMISIIFYFFRVRLLSKIAVRDRMGVVSRNVCLENTLCLKVPQCTFIENYKLSKFNGQCKLYVMYNFLELYSNLILCIDIVLDIKFKSVPMYFMLCKQMWSFKNAPII